MTLAVLITAVFTHGYSTALTAYSRMTQPILSPIRTHHQPITTPTTPPTQQAMLIGANENTFLQRGNQFDVMKNVEGGIEDAGGASDDAGRGLAACTVAALLRPAGWPTFATCKLRLLVTFRHPPNPYPQPLPPTPPLHNRHHIQCGHHHRHSRYPQVPHTHKGAWLASTRLLAC